MTQQTPEIRQGQLMVWNAGNYTADIKLTGGLHTWAPGIPVSRSIPGAEMVPGRNVAVALFDPTNHLDAVVFAVYT